MRRTFQWDGGGLVVEGVEEEILRVRDALRSGEPFSSVGLTLRFLRPLESVDLDRTEGVRFQSVPAARQDLEAMVAREVGHEGLALGELIERVKADRVKAEAYDKARKP